MRICAKRVRSAETIGTLALGGSSSTLTSARWATGLRVVMTSRTTSTASIGSVEIETPPASMRERSRMSSIKRRRCSPPFRICSTRARCRSDRGSFLSRWRSCAKPRIALSGVRSSWLIDERNSDFASLPASASTRALRSSSACRTSSVRSQIVVTMPPSAVLRSVTRSVRPSWVRTS